MASDEVKARLGLNEAFFRDVNEALESGRWPGEEDTPIAFRCECARLGCSEMISVTMRHYEQIRANGRRFIVAVGHQEPEAETVVDERGGYLVVEKRDEAGRLAEASDPRR